MFKEFRAFILRGNVVDLAVGLVIGAAFTSIVTAIVTGFINPLVSFASTGSLETKMICIAGNVTVKGKVIPEACAHAFKYGSVISAIISFVIVAAVVFFFVVKPVNHLTEMFKSDAPAAEPTRECPECLSSIPLAAKRCAYCTALVPVAG